MQPSFHLEELVRQVRSDTLRLLGAATDAQLLWAPPHTSNHVLWHAGHALWLQGVLGVQPIVGGSELPAGWAETFGMNCRPVASTTNWPSREEVRRMLSAQRDRLISLLSKLPAEALAAPHSHGSRRRGLVESLIHGLHDEAKHQGEMYLLIKLFRVSEHP